MKNFFNSAGQVKNSLASFSLYSENDVLNHEKMNCIRGGTADGGDSGIIVPPPPKP